MISKKLVHDIAAFHNTWANNKHIIAGVEIFCGRFISVKFSYYEFTPDEWIDKNRFTITKDIKSRKDYDDYTVEVNHKLAEYLLESDDNE